MLNLPIRHWPKNTEINDNKPQKNMAKIWTETFEMLILNS
jgi:hypothetical protein